MIEVAAGDEPALGAVMVDTVVADGFAVRFEVHGEGEPLPSDLVRVDRAACSGHRGARDRGQ